MRKPTTLWTLTVILLLNAVALIVLAREDWILQAVQSERAIVTRTFGAELANDVHARADRWFSRCCLDNGVVHRSLTMFLPHRPEQTQAVKGMGDQLFALFEGRIRVFWALIYQACYRASAAMAWIPYSLLVFIPWLTDGLLQRRIRQTNFEYSSPARHSAGSMLILLSILSLCAMLFAPIAISPLLVPALLVLISFTTGLLAANFQKKV